MEPISYAKIDNIIRIDYKSKKPIYLQIAESIEDAILSGILIEGEQLPSSTELSATYAINPATALRGINLLVDQSVLYKKRGIGMIVSENARGNLRAQRHQNFYKIHIIGLVEEAERIALTKEEVVALIHQGFEGICQQV